MPLIPSTYYISAWCKVHGTSIAGVESIPINRKLIEHLTNDDTDSGPLLTQKTTWREEHIKISHPQWKNVKAYKQPVHGAVGMMEHMLVFCVFARTYLYDIQTEKLQSWPRHVQML